MRLSLECPTNLLEYLQPFADFDWILAHKAIEDEKYSAFYKESTKIKVVDNSVNEVGEPLPLEEMDKAVEAVGGNFIVAPDWIGDSNKTLSVLSECVKKYGVQKTIAVVQGATFEEAIFCLNSILAIQGIQRIAIPYDISSDKKDLPSLMALRRALLVSNIPNTVYVHLLGFTDINEFIWYRSKPHVSSIDTGVPIMLGLQGADILEPLDSKVQPTLTRMEDIKLTEQGLTAIYRNIGLLRRYMP